MVGVPLACTPERADASCIFFFAKAHAFRHPYNLPRCILFYRCYLISKGSGYETLILQNDTRAVRPS